MASTLSVALITANSSNRLAWWCEQVRRYADHLVIAVDAGCVDDTLAVACRHADEVFAVDTGGEPTLVRDWLHHRCGDDWILLLDDDEILPADAACLLGPLLGDRTFTHYLLPIRQVVDCGADLGWVVDPRSGQKPAVRLWRNLGGLYRSGAGGVAPAVLGRGCSLPEDGPLGVYSLGSAWAGTVTTSALPATAIALDVPRSLGPLLSRTQVPEVSQVISTDQLRRHVITYCPTTPPWSATYRLVNAPTELTTNRGALLRVAVKNTSAALWPTSGCRRGRICLGNRWSTPEFGDEISMGDTSLLPNPVAPGEEVVVEAGLWTPRLPGRYRLTVELMREDDAWFSQHGVNPLILWVSVKSGDAPQATRHYVGRLPDDVDRDPSDPVPSLLVVRPSVRVLDTRDGSGLPDAARGPIGQDGLVVLRIGGAAGVVAHASGVTVMVTVLDADYHGWLAVFGTDGTKGEAFPVVHFADNRHPVTMTVTAALGVGRGHGRLSLHLSPGPVGATAQLLVDVCGYLLPAGRRSASSAQ